MIVGVPAYKKKWKVSRMSNWKNGFGITVVAILICSGFSLLLSSPIGTNGEQPISPPSRAIYRTFMGNLTGLTPQNVGNFRPHLNVSVMGKDSLDADIGPFRAYFNQTTLEFTVEVDIEDQDITKPWTFMFADRYGWNESGNGIAIVMHPSEWPASSAPYHIPNGTLSYTLGVMGNMSFTILNGSSGEPLEGVGFIFQKHAQHTTLYDGTGGLIQGNATDASGNVLYMNMQVGLDQNNNVTLTPIKEHFHIPGYSPSYGRQIREGALSHYTLTLDEDDLVKTYSPPGGPFDHTAKDQVQGFVYVSFFEEMDPSSVNINTTWLEEEGGAKVPTSYIWDATNTKVNLAPLEDLRYDTDYRIVVTPRVTNVTDFEPLWRTFRGPYFTTWKVPGVIRGTVYVNGTTDPAPEGSSIRLDNYAPELLVGGEFNFSNVGSNPPTGHTLTVYGPTVSGQPQYLYWNEGSEPTLGGLFVQRGEFLDIDTLTLTKRPVRSVILTILDEDGAPLEGVNVTHMVTEEWKVSDAAGKVQFDDVLRERVTNFKAIYPNYQDATVRIDPGAEDPTLREVTIYEKELPIEVKARADFTIDLTEDVITANIPVESYIQVDFKDPADYPYLYDLLMDQETMSGDNLKIIDDEGKAIPIDIINGTGDKSRWKLVPRDLLDYAAEYTIFVSEYVTDQYGGNPLWRDYSGKFTTETLDSAAITGRVMIREKGIEGIDLAVMHEGVVLSTAVSGTNGVFLVDIPMTSFDLFDVSLVANGSALGLAIKTLSGLALHSGGSLNDTEIEMSRAADWFVVQYPKDDTGRMPVTGSITLVFKTPLGDPEAAGFEENFTLKSHGDVQLNINVSEDKRTVTLVPLFDLDYEAEYALAVSDFQEGEFNRELRSASGSPALVRGELMDISTEFSPIEVMLLSPSKEMLEKAKINDDISLYFSNQTIDRTRLQSILQIRRAADNESVKNLTFIWSNDRTVNIDHDDFESYTEYYILIPSGPLGTNSARLWTDFLVTFMTEMVPKQIDVIDTFPSIVEVGQKLTVTLENPEARPLRVAILIETSPGSGQFIEYVNITLAASESNRQVTLDVEDLKKGNYEVLIRIYDPTSLGLFHEQHHSISIQAEDGGSPIGTWWIWIVIAIIVILAIVLGVYLFMQSRKKDLDEELKEEFECPECHHLVSAEDSVCPHCGSEFEEEAYKCPKCGAVLDHGDEECSECGYDFSDQDKMELEDEEDEDLTKEYEAEDEDEEMELSEDDEEMEELEE